MPSVTQSITCQLWHPFSNRLTVLFRSGLHQTQPLKQWTVIQTVTGPWTYFFFFVPTWSKNSADTLITSCMSVKHFWMNWVYQTQSGGKCTAIQKTVEYCLVYLRLPISCHKQRNSITLLSFISVSLLVFFFSNFAVKVLRLWPPPRRHVVSALFCKTTDNLKQHYATLLPKTNLKASNPL